MRAPAGRGVTRHPTWGRRAPPQGEQRTGPGKDPRRGAADGIADRVPARRLTLLLLLLTGCAGSIAPYDASQEPARRAALEQHLRTELGPAYDAPVPGLEQADLALGKEIYGKNCDPCHGPYGQGDGPRAIRMMPRPTDLLGTRQLSAAGELGVIDEGSPGTGMPGFGPTMPEGYPMAVYRYVQYLRAHPPPPPDENKGEPKAP